MSAKLSSIRITERLSSKRSRSARFVVKKKVYLKLRVAQGDLTIEVQADNVDVVGVRDVVGAEGLKHVFEVLRAPHTEEPSIGTVATRRTLRRYASGDVVKVPRLYVTSPAARRSVTCPQVERMLAKARQILESEVALTGGCRRGSGPGSHRRSSPPERKAAYSCALAWLSPLPVQGNVSGRRLLKLS